MPEIEERLVNCFVAVFPELDRAEAITASSESVQGWDSVAGVTLLAVVEEEFGMSIEVQDLSTLTSYQGFLSYLEGVSGDSRECQTPGA